MFLNMFMCMIMIISMASDASLQGEITEVG